MADEKATTTTPGTVPPEQATVEVQQPVKPVFPAAGNDRPPHFGLPTILDDDTGSELRPEDNPGSRAAAKPHQFAG